MIRSVACLYACFVALTFSLAAQAQSPVAFEDTLAQRVLACTGCHGKQGRAGPDGYYPRLAGKPVGYLYNQLRNFQSGRRHYALMVNLLEPLSDTYVREIAEHFASLELPYEAAVSAKLPATLEQRGQALAMVGDPTRKLPACAECHGQALMGLQPFVPSLLGLSRDYLNAQLGAWRTGQRQAHAPDCMAEVAKRLTPEDVSAVVSWLATQAVPTPSKAAARLPAPMPWVCGSTQVRLPGAGVRP